MTGAGQLSPVRRGLDHGECRASALLWLQLVRHHFHRGHAEVGVMGHGFHDGAHCWGIPIGGCDRPDVLAVDRGRSAERSLRYELERLELARGYRDSLV